MLIKVKGRIATRNDVDVIDRVTGKILARGRGVPRIRRGFNYEKVGLTDLEIDTDTIRGETWPTVGNVLMLVTVDGVDYTICKSDQDPETVKKLPRFKKRRPERGEPFATLEREPV